MLIRRIGSLLIGLAGLWAGLLAVANGMNVEHTIANAQRLDRQFRQAAPLVDAFRLSKGRLPSEDELGGLVRQQAINDYQVSIAPNGFDQCDGNSRDYIHLPPGAYVLFAWRGEWFECFAPSTNKSTLDLNESDLTLTTSINVDRLVFSLFAVACLLAAMRLWRRKDIVEN